MSQELAKRMIQAEPDRWKEYDAQSLVQKLDLDAVSLHAYMHMMH
jgi:hypothetical protein